MSAGRYLWLITRGSEIWTWAHRWYGMAGWLLWQGGANKTHVAINRAWSRGRRRAGNNGRLVAGRGKESSKGRKRESGSREQSETEKGYFLVLHIGGPTRQPSIRSSESTRVLWSIALTPTTSSSQFPVVEKHLVRPPCCRCYCESWLRVSIIDAR